MKVHLVFTLSTLFWLHRYRWMVYINPNYYGFSSSAFFLLSEFDSGCEGSQFECFTSSGEYILQQFNFNNINPYLHIVVSYEC